MAREAELRNQQSLGVAVVQGMDEGSRQTDNSARQFNRLTNYSELGLRLGQKDRHTCANTPSNGQAISGLRPMPNSRISISIIAFVSGFMLIWLLISWVALGPADVAPLGSLRLVYFLGIFVLFAYFWVYFFRRPRGGKTLVDGRTALSGSAFIVGVATGYAFIEFGFIASQTAAGQAAGSFAIFVGCTLLPIMAWLVVSLNSLCRRNAALRREAQS